MKLWTTLKGQLMLTFPYVVSTSTNQGWGFSFKRLELVINSDTTSPYSILHVGPVEMFIRPKSIMLDWA